MICLALLCLVLILLVLFYIRTEKAAYDRLSFGFMDEFSASSGGHAQDPSPLPVVHERIEHLPEGYEEEEDDVLLEEDAPDGEEELPCGE